MALAAALRLYHLDHESLWYDESFSIAMSRAPFGALWHQLLDDAIHPPLFPLALFGWIRLFGDSVFACRLLGLVASVATVPLVHALAGRVFGRRAALLAALLFALSQVGILSGQMARYPAFMILAAAWFGLAAFDAWRRGRRRDLVHAAVAALVALYTHFFLVFLVLGAGLFLLLARRSGALRPRALLAAGAAVALLVLPWLGSGVVRRGEETERFEARTRPPWQQASWKTPALIVTSFANGKTNGLDERDAGHLAHRGAIVLAIVLVAAPLAVLALRTLRRREDVGAVLYLGVLALAPGAAALATLFDFPFRERYAYGALPAFLVLTAGGLDRLGPPALRRTWIVVLLAFWAFALRSNYFIPYRLNARDAVATAAAGWREGDLCASAPGGFRLREWDYYGAKAGLAIVPVTEVLAGQVAPRRVWLFTQRQRIPFAGDRDKAAMLERWRLVEEWRGFHLIHLGLYEPR